MNRTRLGPVLALLALVLALSALLGTGSATATRTPPPWDQRADPGQPTFTEAEAKDVLARAKSQLRPDTKRVRSGKPVGQGPGSEITMTLRDLFLARTALSGQERQEADAVLARPSDSGGDSIDPSMSQVSYDGRVRKHHCPTGGVACVHWVTAGYERIVDVSDDDGVEDGDGVPDYVESVYATITQVWDYEIGALDYRRPMDDAGPFNADNPDPKLDIYLAELGDRGLYGYCAPEGPTTSSRVSGYCVLDNDYSSVEFGAPPLNSLRVTAAHEFFHAVQFGYDVDEAIWFMEGTATWVEDEVYDSINDNYQFLAYSPIRYPRTSLDRGDGGYPYGSFIFFKYASERGDPAIVRNFWESAEADGRTSVAAIRGVVGAAAWPSYFALFASWNTLPRHSYSERTGYPTPSFTFKKTLSSGSPSTGWRSANVGHLGSSPGLVAPSSTLSTAKRLRVEVNGPNRSLGTAALLQRRYKDGRVSHSMLTLNGYGNASVLVGFNRTSISSITVILSNTASSGPTREFKMRATLR